MNHYHRSSASWGTRLTWLAAFVLATVLFNVGLTCAVPLVAFAAICALRQSRGQALLFVTVLWGVTELIGFTVLNFPMGWVAFGWAALVGGSLLVATWVAGAVARRAAHATGVVATLASAFVVYEGLLWAVSRIVGAAQGAFTAGILTQVFVLNAVTFTALLLVGALATRGPRIATWLGKKDSAWQRTA